MFQRYRNRGLRRAVVLLAILAFLGLAALVKMLWIRGHAKAGAAREELFYSVLGNLAFLDSCKSQAAIEERLTNGFEIRFENIEPYLLTDQTRKWFAPYILSGWNQDTMKRAKDLQFVFVLNPVGVPVRLRFLRRIGPARTGMEITANEVPILQDLGDIELWKERVAESSHWGYGHPVEQKDLASYLSSQGTYFDGTNRYGAVFSINPIGVPPKARVVSSLLGLPIGKEITLDNP